MRRAGFNMIIMITEDIGSARTFWINVLDNTVGSGNYRISDDYSSTDDDNSVIKKTGGKSTLEPKIDYVIKNKKYDTNDTLFVVFDNIGNTFSKNKSSAAFIRNSIKKCERNSLKFMTTTYYCFEEIYLSYKDVKDRYKNLSKANINMISTLEYVYKCINSNVDYYDTTNIDIQNSIKELYKTPSENKTGLNREQFAAMLLEFVTRQFFSKFHISKSSTGFECYLEDCEAIRKSIEQINRAKIKEKAENKNKEINEEAIKKGVQNICNKCTYSCKDADALTKIEDIFNNSILKNARYTYTDFKDM